MPGRARFADAVVVVVEKSEPLSTNTNTRRAFAALIEPLELRAGCRFGNPQRAAALKMFEENPEGVRAVVRSVLREAAVQRPLGVLWHRLSNGWHELEPLPARNANGSRSLPRLVDDCVRCGKIGSLDAVSLLCEDCDPNDVYTRA